MKKFVTVAGATMMIAGSTIPAFTTEASAATKKTEITFWHAMTGNNEAVLNKLIEEFNNSQTKYEVVANGQGNYSTLQQKIMAAAKSKTLPVMAQAAYTSVPTYVDNGIISNLDNFVNANDGKGKKAIDNMYSAFKASATYDGHYYTVPFAKSLRVMIYNKGLLDKYGLSVPKTWTELKKDADIVSKDSIAAGTYDQSFGQELQSMSKAAGVDMVGGQKDNFKAHFSNKKVIQAANSIVNMLKTGKLLTAGTETYGTTNFVNSKALVYFASSAGLPSIQSSIPDGFDWGVAPLPTYDGKVKTVVGGSDLIATKQSNTKEKQGAWKFMQFLISNKSTTEWAAGTGYLPLTKKAVKSDEYQKFLEKYPKWKANVDSLPYAFSAPVFPNYDSVWYGVGMDAINNMISGKQTPKQALTRLQKLATNLINEAK